MEYKKGLLMRQNIRYMVIYCDLNNWRQSGSIDYGE